MVNLQVESSHRQTIVTKYRGPTNTRGSRFYASCDAGKLSIPYDYSLSATQNHEAAAEALARKLDWQGRMVGGSLPDGRMVFVFVD